MIVLGIDTSGTTASAAVRTDQGTATARSDQPRAHGRVLPGLVSEAVATAGIGLPDLTHVAVARGPGLFTGMRVGLVSAEMIAYALGVPVVGVSTLGALAARVVRLHRPTTDFAVLVDARRKEVFAQAFAPDGESVDEPRTLGLAVAGAAGTEALGAVFLDAGLAGSGPAGAVVLRTDGLAAEVAAVAAHRWCAGAEQEPALPIYLRRPDTTRANPARSVLGAQ